MLVSNQSIQNQNQAVFQSQPISLDHQQRSAAANRATSERQNPNTIQYDLKDSPKMNLIRQKVQTAERNNNEWQLMGQQFN